MKRWIQRGVIALAAGVLLAFGALIAVRSTITDEQLTEWAEDALNTHFAGQFSIEEVRWQLPLHINVQKLQVLSPHAQPVLQLQSLQATVHPWSLLHGVLAIDHVVIDGADVDVGVPKKGDPPLAQAWTLTPLPPEVPPEQQQVPLHIAFDDVTLVHSHVVVHGGGARLQVNDVHLEHGNVWLGGDAVGGDIQLACSVQAAVQAKDIKHRVPPTPLHIQADDVVFHFATQTPRIEAGNVAVHLPGIDVRTHGDVCLNANSVQDANAHASITVNTENATLRQQLPMKLTQHLRGAATLDVDVQAHNEVVHAIADLHESRFEIFHQPIQQLHADGTWADGQLTVRALRASVNQGDVAVEGNMRIHGDTIGTHDISCKLHDFPVKALAGQFIGLPQLLPETVSLNVSSQGRSLLPPTSEVMVDVVPNELPGARWPGLPHSMELRGRFLTHPDLLEVLKLEVHIEHLPSFAIQGALPMHEQSIIDLLQEIHAAHPTGPLHRIPAAPTSTDAL